MRLKNLIYLPLILAGSYFGCKSTDIDTNRGSTLEAIKIDKGELDKVNLDRCNTYFSRSFSPEDIERVLYIAEQDYKSVIRDIDNPYDASIYCTEFLKHGGVDIDMKIYGKSDYWASFKNIHEHKVDDCDGGAVAAASLLSDDGFLPYILYMYGKNYDHVVFLYENTRGFYGSIGINKTDVNPPILHSIDELARKIWKDVSLEEFKSYDVIDLSLIFPDFINTDLGQWLNDG